MNFDGSWWNWLWLINVLRNDWFWVRSQMNWLRMVGEEWLRVGNNILGMMSDHRLGHWLVGQKWAMVGEMNWTVRLRMGLTMA